MTDKYPEHEKLAKVSDISQPLGEILDWMLNKQGYVIAKWVFTGKDSSDPWGHDELVTQHVRIEALLADFYQIDLAALDREKDQMLAEIREAYARRENS